MNLLQKFPDLEFLHCGISTGFSDAILPKLILEKSGLKQLKILHVAHSDLISISSLKLLLAHCLKLREITDIEAFTEISQEETQEIRHFVKSNNLDVNLQAQTCNTQGTINLQFQHLTDCYNI